MNSNTLDLILSNCQTTAPYFIGVFASDKIPTVKNKRYPYCFVANTGRAGTIGEHWVACFVTSQNIIEYFDSLGEYPNQDLSAYLNQFDKILFNDRIVQHPFSDACGHFCIYFLTYRCSKIPYCAVIDSLYKAHPMADLLAKKFVRHVSLNYFSNDACFSK